MPLTAEQYAMAEEKKRKKIRNSSMRVLYRCTLKFQVDALHLHGRLGKSKETADRPLLDGYDLRRISSKIKISQKEERIVQHAIGYV